MDKIKTAEQVIKEMNTDKSYYSDFMQEMALKYLKANPDTLQSWLDWFNVEDDEWLDEERKRPEDIL